MQTHTLDNFVLQITDSPCYSCFGHDKNHDCFYPADMLHWHKRGFYCGENCIGDKFFISLSRRGRSLEQELALREQGKGDKNRKLPAPRYECDGCYEEKNLWKAEDLYYRMDKYNRYFFYCKRCHPTWHSPTKPRTLQEILDERAK